uniref:Uncharacterized protein n=1 Tax=Musca domestica TaxID=7370 RepID=A0A1I8N7Q6_MUSDO
DFNMQDETTIPEDIFDQRHLQEIEEKEQLGSIGNSSDGGAKGGESVDIIDVNLPYDDSDADAEAEADIILESQRSSERNFNSSDDTNNNGDEASSPGIVYMTQVRPGHVDGVTKVDSLRKTFNKKDIFKEKVKAKYKPGGGGEKKTQQEVKYESTSPRYTYDFPETDLSSFAAVDNYEDAIDDDEEDDDDGSAEYERFKYMHEKKLREQKEREEQKKQQQLQQKLHQQTADVDNSKHVGGDGGQMPLIKKLNERKFNKPTKNENEKFSAKDGNDHHRADDQRSHDDNDGMDASDNDEDNAYNDSKADKNVDVDTDDSGANIDYDRHPIWEEQQQQEPNQKSLQQQSQDAIGDIAAEENDNENQSPWQVSKMEAKDFPNVFIPRKMKRHNGAARLDDATNRYTRIKQEQPVQHLRQHANTPPHNSAASDGGDNSKDDATVIDSQEEYMSHYRPAKETNFQKSHYGRTNGNVSEASSGSEATQRQQPQQQQKSLISLQRDEEHGYSFTTTKGNSNNNVVSGEMRTEQENGLSSNRDEMETLEMAPKATATSATTATYEDDDEQNKRQSLFEREKSLRRNSKHYGHKIHKKKYKDYQHYYSVMMMRQHPTTTAAVAVATHSPTAVMTTSTPPLPERTTKKPPMVTKLIKMDNTNRNDGGDNLRYRKKLKMERMKAMPPSPIFVLKSSRGGGHEIPTTMSSLTASNKPFYEGQINYYLETEDGDDEARASEARFITKGDRMDTNDWYRKLSPVLRNGVKTSGHQEDRTMGSGMGRPAGGGGGVGGGYTPYHHLRNHHSKHHHHHQHNPHNHHHHSRNHAYQRKMLPKKALVTTTPLPPPSRKHSASSSSSSSSDESTIHELAHQITDLKEFERYYAKWPHLARVQSQLHDEQLREQLELQNLQKQQLGNYQDYEYDEEYFEALQGIRTPMADNVEENLPPYIRKYNRRNKQLLDLLEGTLPPPTRPPHQLRWAGSKLQPGPREASSVGSMSVRIDDDYLKEKRKRYHQRQKQIHDLFEEQRATSTTTSAPTTAAAAAAPTTMPASLAYSYGSGRKEQHMNDNNDNSEPELENHLPDEDVSVSMETAEEHQDTNWQKEIASKSTSSSSTSTAFSAATSSNSGNSPIPWQMEKLITPSTKNTGGNGALATASAVTPKPAIFKLPSYPSIAGSYIQRPRSRSAQFAPSSGSEFRRVTPSLYGGAGAASNNNNNFINAGGFVAYNGHNLGPKSMAARFNGQNKTSSTTTVLTPSSLLSNTSKSNNNNHVAGISTSSLTSSSSSTRTSSRSSSPSSAASVSNSFVYHRVVDASPRLVGAGLTGRKQRLPFVAITDRRLETSKKSLMDHQKDFEQNHYPLP